MANENLRQRHPPAPVQTLDSKPTNGAPKLSREDTPHPGGEIKHGPWQQALRMFLFAVYFNGSILASVQAATEHHYTRD
jgi:lysocardiolipin and lysophospholipid acyltransferase